MFLYTSWKSDSDLKRNYEGKECPTYKEAYFSWKHIIDPIYHEYNGFQRAVEDALLENGESLSDNEDDMEPISAATTDSVNILDEWECQERENEKYQPFLIKTAAFLPETDESSDIGVEMGLSRKQEQGMGAVTSGLTTKTPEEIDVLYRKLNHQQQLFVANILKRVEAETESELIFLTGGPGVGKSEVLKVIDFGIDNIYSKVPGEIKCRHIKMAPTGAAACVLGRGTGTIHATLKIPVNQSIDSYIPLSPGPHGQLADLKSKGLHHLKWVIIDEISMVGSRVCKGIPREVC